jgi:hypothetical protein
MPNLLSSREKQCFNRINGFMDFYNRQVQKVVIPLMGGLGNQLFQIAAGFELRQRLDIEVAFSDALLKAFLSRGVTRRNFDSELFLKPHETNSSLFLDRGKLAWTIKSSSKVLQKEELLNSESGYVITNRTKYLMGYFQNYKLVNQVESQLLERFRPFAPSSISTIGVDLHDSIGVHVRYGDYLHNPVTRAFHGLSTPSYYLSTIEYLVEAFNIHKVMIFSDDSRRAQNELGESLSGTVDFAVSPSTNSNIEDLFALSSCAAVIASNSTFSWWAAWIASVTRGVPVVLPQPWFAAYRPEQDLIYFPSAIRFKRDVVS